MAKNIEPKLRKIGDYLKLSANETFVIPEYQRAYSWEIKQCDKLWQDIESFMDTDMNDPYFFGTIIINCQDDDTKLSLIDGQQRTTTFILLFKALLIRMNEAISDTVHDSDSERLKRTLSMKRDKVIKILYKADDEGVFDILEDFNNKNNEEILVNRSINELYNTELSTILNSKNFEEAEDSVIKIKYKQKDNKFTNYFRNFKFFYRKLLELSPSNVNLFAECVLNKTEIIEIRSWNVDQAITMFNSLNSAGMPLLDADIISAQLYSNAGDERLDFNERWAELKKKVTDLEQNKVADIDSILLHYMYIQRALDKAYISEGGAVNVTTPGIRRYYTDDNKELLENPLGLTARLLKIAKIWTRIKNYSMVQLSFKFNENLKIFLISYLFRFELDEISEKLVADFLNQLLKLFAVLELVDIGYSSSKFKTFLFGLNTKLVDENIPLEEVNHEIHRHIIKNWGKDSIKENILNYSKNALVYLDEYIFCLANDQQFILPEKYEIEHIMPRSGKNIDQIREDAGLVDKEEFLAVVNQLGNKILLEENINRSIGNAWFRTKIQSSVIEKKGYKDSQFCLPSTIINRYKDEEMPAWQVEDINERTEVIADRISDFIFSE